ncbi:MAG: hypothetical protein WBM96_17245 [Polyangiales bacterium]
MPDISNWDNHRTPTSGFDISTLLDPDGLREHSSISSFPATSVPWTDFGDSSLNFQRRAYTRNIDDSYTVRSDLRFAIFKAFKDAGIVIPFPQRDLHIQANDTPEGSFSKDGPNEDAGK